LVHFLLLQIASVVVAFLLQHRLQLIRMRFLHLYDMLQDMSHPNKIGHLIKVQRTIIISNVILLKHVFHQTYKSEYNNSPRVTHVEAASPAGGL